MASGKNPPTPSSVKPRQAASAAATTEAHAKASSMLKARPHHATNSSLLAAHALLANTNLWASSPALEHDGCLGLADPQLAQVRMLHNVPRRPGLAPSPNAVDMSKPSIRGFGDPRVCLHMPLLGLECALTNAPATLRARQCIDNAPLRMGVRLEAATVQRNGTLSIRDRFACPHVSPHQEGDGVSRAVPIHDGLPNNPSPCRTSTSSDRFCQRTLSTSARYRCVACATSASGGWVKARTQAARVAKAKLRHAKKACEQDKEARPPELRWITVM